MFPKKTYLRYVVVHFFDEDEVEAAPSLWIEWCDGVLYCYWPHSSASIMAKKYAAPDKNLWSKHAVRVLSETDSYAMARYRARKAQDTSNVEESDANESRKITLPHRFRDKDDQPDLRKRRAPLCKCKTVY
ncbi:uncharacterized protein LOC111195954 isoform X1 [Astyanax mexicanus]|uniref:uncharacterized protein LOC111195954 isoform X1 n=1 Tax=Astyanax mexicanus TaxID=7994 RepID=UPI000BBD56D3|nr:uncharacterized protein LOC111195954 isoform X1 [Astyanax mexicanus]